MDSWKSSIKFKKWFNVDEVDESSMDGNGIISGSVSKSQAYVFHEKHTKGAHLRKLQDSKYHQIYWETPYYHKILNGFLNDKEISDGYILDFGCGDGRITKYLLERGATKIVCVDFDYSTLLSLWEFVKEGGYEERVLIIHSDYENMPFVSSQFTTIIALGVLYYLNDRYEEALGTFHGLLGDKGKMITGDPELEGFFLRALVLESFEDALNIFNDRKFKETKEKTGFEFRVFDQNEWISIFSKVGFEVIDYQGVSLFHNILRILMLRGVIEEKTIEKHEKDIWKILDYFHESGNLNKHVIWNLRKN